VEKTARVLERLTARRYHGAARSPNGVRRAEGASFVFVTTTNDITGYRIVRYLGMVRGVTVRSRSIVGNIGAMVQSLFGGHISLYTELAERSREEAYDRMAQHAEQLGANAVIAMRYDANDMGNGITEVLAYGTAVVVEPV
jgi:uncharacterized protein YbjQ (UPF0145 family)